MSRLPVGLAITTLVYPAPASTHLNATAMGPVSDGVAPFLTSQQNVLPSLALALRWAARTG